MKIYSWKDLQRVESPAQVLLEGFWFVVVVGLIIFAPLLLPLNR